MRHVVSYTRIFVYALVLALAPLSAHASDTDGDGFPDALEVVLGTDPSLATSTPTGAPANAQPFTPAIFVSLNFTGADAISVSLTSDGLIDPATLSNTKAAFLVGGVARAVTLDATGFGQDTNGDTQASFFSESNVSSFAMSTFGEFEPDFIDEGLTQSVTGLKAVSIEAALFFNGVLYVSSDVSGIYEVTSVPDVGNVGQALFNFGSSEEVSFDITLTDVTVSPAPAAVGDTVSVDLALKAKGIKLDDVSGVVDFGDGSTPVEVSGTNLESITHVYTAEGAYDISIILLGTLDGQRVSVGATAFAVVGDDTAVNPGNGLVTKASVTPGDGGAVMANAQFQLSSLEDSTVTDASTSFEELDGLAPQPESQGVSRDVVDGLLPSRSVAKPSLTVATSTAKSASGQTRGTARKTVAVGSRTTNPTNSGNLKPPKNNPGEVTVTKVSGKFIFSTDAGKNKPDQVTFSGELTLPEGFAAEAPDGIRFAIGLGNVLDGVMLDAKGKPLNKSTGDKKRLKKVSVKFPKLSGPATGTEVAKISVTMSTEDMDLKGFESEGITSRVRDDEKGQKAVDRMMQVNLMLGGEPYEAYIPVEFKLSTKGDAGTMVTRRAN